MAIPKNAWLEVPLVVIMMFGTAYTLYKRLNMKKADGNPMGLGRRVHEMVALLMLVPIIGVLAVEDILPKEVVGTLLGTIIGYTLSGISDSDRT